MPRALVTALVTALSLALGGAREASAQPSIPATFFGSATIDGGRVPEDTPVRALIDGVDCTQDGPGATDDGRTSVYAILVVADSQRTGCGREGVRVVFTIGGLPARQTATWRSAVQQLDLDAPSGRPTPAATPTAQRPVPTAMATAARTAPPAPPTDDVTPPPIGGAGRTARPSPSVPAAADGEDGRAGGLAVIVALALGAVALVAGVSGFALSRSRRSGRKR